MQVPIVPILVVFNGKLYKIVVRKLAMMYEILGSGLENRTEYECDIDENVKKDKWSCWRGQNKKLITIDRIRENRLKWLVYILKREEIEAIRVVKGFYV